MECQKCGTKTGTMYMLQPAQHSEDTYCEKCKVPEMEKRAKAK